MNIQADISWIKAELTDVEDPNLIEAFKNMLKYRKTKRTTTQEELQQRTQESLEAIERGETTSLSAFQTENKEWLNNRASR
jgi:hypothetical protein